LLGIDITTSRQFEREIVKGSEGIKPGWVRVNFNYFISETVFQFILKAVHLVANEGWKLLPFYQFNPATGEWRHRDGHPEPKIRLINLKYNAGKLEYRARHATEPEWVLDQYLEEARRVLDQAEESAKLIEVRDPSVSDDFEYLRWFPTSGEIADELCGRGCSSRHTQPIHIKE
jgi:hypothetical protein